MDAVARYREQPGFRPLYQQVRDLLLSRISAGVWRPAESLPSEQALAAELGVSQGTVRKALDSLVAENLIERRQGKGTFVAKHTSESTHFRFFKLTYDDGGHAEPTCRESIVTRRTSEPHETEQLGLSPDADVYVLHRTRLIDDKPILRERIVVPVSVFPGLDAKQPIPNTLYTFYQSEYNVYIANASEKLKSVAADQDIANALILPFGTPVLLVDRIAFGVNGRPVELRRSHINTDIMHYAVNLG